MTRGRRRGWVVGLAAFAAADAIVEASRARPVILIRRLPEPPGRARDSNRVVTSPVAYALGVPDAPIAVAVYLAVAGFAARLGRGAARRRPWSALGLAAGSAGAAAGAAFYLWEQRWRARGGGAGTRASAATTFAMLPLALPELPKLFR